MNTPFLQKIAKLVLDRHKSRLDEVILIFPNRRAGLFFRKYLAEDLKKPVWSPTIYSMEDFVGMHSNLQLADRFLLIAELFKVYKRHMGESEEFDKFYYWGELLLTDFDDIDKYLIDAQFLFADVNRQKELDAYFDYLTEEQRKIISEFWSQFNEHPSDQKKEFSKLWNTLPEIYKEFISILKTRNLAYSGMIYKEVASDPSNIGTTRPIIFAGFNALTASEEKIITHCLSNGAEIYWDADQYYLDNVNQEAGHFMRSYRVKNSFSKSFQNRFPDQISNHSERNVKLCAVSQEIGQAKLLGNHLQQLINSDKIDPEKTLVVLPDEHLLIPVLSAIPDVVMKVNVTMGFPMVNTPIYSLIDHLLELQRNSRSGKVGESFYYKNVLNILKHPIIQRLIPSICSNNVLLIEKENKMRIAVSEIESDGVIVPMILTRVESAMGMINYLKKVIGQVSATKDSSPLEKEYAYQFYTQLNKLEEIVEQFGMKMSSDSFVRLFRQVMSSLRLPFTGEPLNGLQVMGVLETRNLDFDHVFILSMNEGVFPSQSKLHSYIPYNLRKAYGLPTYEFQDAIYAYLFYRLFQQSKSVHLYYNTEEGKTGGGELSRFVQQLIHETKYDIKKTILAHELKVEVDQPISIDKNVDVLSRMRQLYVEEDNKLTPSALNMYLDCKLKFYFRYIARLYEYDEIQDDVDAAVLGNLLHSTMEYLYSKFKSDQLLVEVGDLNSIEPEIEKAIDLAFQDQYFIEEGKKYTYEGRQLIAKEVVRKYAKLIVDYDKGYAPFEVTGLEENEYSISIPIDNGTDNFEVGVKGVIDRIDRKGERVRVIDYKTGQDSKKVDTIDSLFDRDHKSRNKAGLQTMLYALLYSKNHPEFNGAIIPGVFNVKDLAGENSSYQLEIDKELVNNAGPMLSEFEGHLVDMMQEIFSPYVPFDQTNDEKKCSYCPYKGICRK